MISRQVLEFHPFLYLFFFASRTKFFIQAPDFNVTKLLKTTTTSWNNIYNPIIVPHTFVLLTCPHYQNGSFIIKIRHLTVDSHYRQHIHTFEVTHTWRSIPGRHRASDTAHATLCWAVLPPSCRHTHRRCHFVAMHGMRQPRSADIRNN